MFSEFSLRISPFLSKSELMPIIQFNLTQFNKDKYIQMSKSMGISATLTRLHEDIREWERESFEGEAGYQPEMVQEIVEIRKFSRELWEMALQGISQ
jgi:hypothetical protein